MLAVVTDAAEVAQHLGGRRDCILASHRAIKRPCPALALDNRSAMFIPSPFLRLGIGAILGVTVDEQQAIGNVEPAPSGEILLPEALRPTQFRKNRPDEVIFCLAFVRR